MAAKVIAVDLDGVLYEWDRTAQYMLRTYRGLRHMHTESASWDWIKDNVSPEDWKWLWSEGVERGLFRYGHMTTGARVGLEHLVDAGFKLKIVTHRPASAVMDTIDWLSLYLQDIPLAGIHILSNQEPKTVVDADILVDDKPQNLVEWKDEGRIALQYARKWNRSFFDADIDWCDGWSDVPKVLRERGLYGGAYAHPTLPGMVPESTAVTR